MRGIEGLPPWAPPQADPVPSDVVTIGTPILQGFLSTGRGSPQMIACYPNTRPKSRFKVLKSGNSVGTPPAVASRTRLPRQPFSSIRHSAERGGTDIFM